MNSIYKRIGAVAILMATTAWLANTPAWNSFVACIGAVIAYVTLEYVQHQESKKPNKERSDVLDSHQLAAQREREARAHADRNERDARLRAFEGFLVAKETCVEAASAAHVPAMYFDSRGALYNGEFRIEAAKVRRDISPNRQAEFQRANDAMSHMAPGVLSAGDSRENLAGAIRAMLAFIRSE